MQQLLKTALPNTCHTKSSSNVTVSCCYLSHASTEINLYVSQHTFGHFTRTETKAVTKILQPSTAHSSCSIHTCLFNVSYLPLVLSWYNKNNTHLTVLFCDNPAESVPERKNQSGFY